MGSIQTTRSTEMIQVQTVRSTTIQQDIAPPPPPPAPPAEDKFVPSSPTKILKNTLGGALIGGGALSAAQSIAKSIGTESLQAPSWVGAGLGIALGAGIGLVNLKTDNAGLNTAKNTVGAALIGGSIGGVATSIIKTIGTESLSRPSVAGILIGGAIGAGIAVLNAKE